MIEIRQTAEYEKWFRKLRDRTAKSRILIRVRRMSDGNPGDAKTVEGRVSELRIDYGPGYRIYFVRIDRELAVLLTGGDKSTQQRDIERARDLARELLQEEPHEQISETECRGKGEDTSLGSGGLS